MHIRRNDVTGQLIQISLLWSQMEAGTSSPFYTKSYYHTIRMQLTKTWITNLIDYIEDCNMELHLTGFRTPKIVRQNPIYGKFP